MNTVPRGSPSPFAHVVFVRRVLVAVVDGGEIGRGRKSTVEGEVRLGTRGREIVH